MLVDFANSFRQAGHFDPSGWPLRPATSTNFDHFDQVGPLLELGAQERPALGRIAQIGTEHAGGEIVFQDGLPQGVALYGDV